MDRPRTSGSVTGKKEAGLRAPQLDVARSVESAPTHLFHLTSAQATSLPSIPTGAVGDGVSAPAVADLERSAVDIAAALERKFPRATTSEGRWRGLHAAKSKSSATLLRRPLTSNNPDPSRHRGNTRVIELPVRSTDPYFNRVSYANASASLLEEIDTDSRLGHWLRAFSLDEESFASKAVFVEARLRQAMASSEALDTPNAFRAAVVCDAFERVAPLTGRYETVLTLIWRELVRLIYADYSDDLPGSGTRRHFTR